MNLSSEIAKANEEDTVQIIERIEFTVDPQIKEQLANVMIHAAEKMVN